MENKTKLTLSIVFAALGAVAFAFGLYSLRLANPLTPAIQVTTPTTMPEFIPPAPQHPLTKEETAIAKNRLTAPEGSQLSEKELKELEARATPVDKKTEISPEEMKEILKRLSVN